MIYDGNWINDKPDGYGTYYFTDGSVFYYKYFLFVAIPKSSLFGN